MICSRKCDKTPKYQKNGYKVWNNQILAFSTVFTKVNNLITKVNNQMTSKKLCICWTRVTLTQSAEQPCFKMWRRIVLSSGWMWHELGKLQMSKTLVMLPWPGRMKSKGENWFLRTSNESESIIMGHWPERRKWFEIKFRASEWERKYFKI